MEIIKEGKKSGVNNPTDKKICYRKWDEQNNKSAVESTEKVNEG